MGLNALHAKGNTQQAQNIVLKPARVVHVVLHKESPYYNQYGASKSIGGIVFEWTEHTSAKEVVSQTLFAYPLFGNIKQIPVENEIVYVGLANGPSLVDLEFQSNTYYYFPPINIWTSTQHNAAPNFYSNQSKSKKQLGSYATAQQTTVDANAATHLEFENGFVENPKIQPLQPLAGDLLFEGRWGNSIRLSCTNKLHPNVWSQTGAAGDPIILLRNQQTAKGKTWDPIFENINQDGASIYLTSTQQIEIDAPNWSAESYVENAPQAPSQFAQTQTILLADRILANAKTDSIILTAAKTVHVSGKSFHVDVEDEMNVYASKIILGDPKLQYAIQPVLKGDDTKQLLDNIIKTLSALTQACAVATGAIPIASLNNFAVQYLPLVETLNTNTIQSEDVFII